MRGKMFVDDESEKISNKGAIIYVNNYYSTLTISLKRNETHFMAIKNTVSVVQFSLFIYSLLNWDGATSLESCI